MALILMISLPGLGAAADAKDCTRATPLPADTTITAPAADVPADLAKFSGVWGGAWTDRSGGGPCSTLVVEEIFANGSVRVIQSLGAALPVLSQPRHWRTTGQIVDDVLRFALPAVPPTEVACPRRPATVSPSGGLRDRITTTELRASAWAGDGPVHNDYFMPVGAAAPARHALRGTLTIPAATLAGAWQGCVGGDRRLPGFSVEFITHGEHLVPAVRGIVRSPGATGPPGEGVILPPGRVWSEPRDQGMSRASFPFVLVHPIHNGTHNGLATFVFDDTRVSQLRIQFTQETMEWERDDYWGQAPMTYASGAVADEARLRAQFDTERRLEMPIRPWSSLPVAHRSPWFDAFDGDTAPEDINANGLVVDGVLYLKGCHTRSGPYPYCRHMRHGAFSVTKSLGAGLALLRLAAKYGDGVLDLKIADYVRVTAAHDGWEYVTFGDALGMVAPIGNLGARRDWPDPEPDDSSPPLVAWMEARTARDKLDRAFAYGRYPWTRGEVVRYNSTLTFVLAAAMDAFLKRREGPSAHLWDMVVVQDVYRPIGIFHAPTMHTLEPDGSRGLPLLAYGFTPTIDEIAKLATLLQHGGRHDGVQILSAARTAEALSRAGPLGLSTLRKNRFGDQRHHLSFWSVAYRTGLILAGEAIRPFCASTPADTPPPPASAPPLSAAELQAELSGNTFTEGALQFFVAADGRLLLAAAGGHIDVGRWRVTPDGRYCRAWTATDGGRDRSFRVSRDDETFVFDTQGRWTVTRATRTRGRGSDF